jgi:hypothetical protein
MFLQMTVGLGCASRFLNLLFFTRLEHLPSDQSIPCPATRQLPLPSLARNAFPSFQQTLQELEDLKKTIPALLERFATLESYSLEDIGRMVTRNAHATPFAATRSYMTTTQPSQTIHF